MSWVGPLLLAPGLDVLAPCTNVRQAGGFGLVPRFLEFGCPGMDSTVQGSCMDFLILWALIAVLRNAILLWLCVLLMS